MIPLNKLMYKAQKESVALLVNRIMAEKNPETRKKTLRRLTTIMETFFGDLFEEESFASLTKAASGSNSSTEPWIHSTPT